MTCCHLNQSSELFRAHPLYKFSVLCGGYSKEWFSYSTLWYRLPPLLPFMFSNSFYFFLNFPPSLRKGRERELDSDSVFFRHPIHHFVTCNTWVSTNPCHLYLADKFCGHQQFSSLFHQQKMAFKVQIIEQKKSKRNLKWIFGAQRVIKQKNLWHKKDRTPPNYVGRIRSNLNFEVILMVIFGKDTGHRGLKFCTVLYLTSIYTFVFIIFLYLA